MTALTKSQRIAQLEERVRMKDLLLESQRREMRSYLADIEFLHELMREGLKASPLSSGICGQPILGRFGLRVAGQEVLQNQGNCVLTPGHAGPHKAIA